jgi:glycosyltransferase involved in cell wall biosynthesis
MRRTRGQTSPLLSVNIPTKNSASTIEKCLAAVVSQPVPVEIIVADDRSTDGTQAIAERFGAQVLSGHLPLLEARYQAASRSTADVLLLLDSDQILRGDALSRIVDGAQRHDMIILGEDSSEADTWLAKLYEADKRHVYSLYGYHSNPQGGSLLPRVFRRSVLMTAFDRIPLRVRQLAVAQDHAIIYQAAARSAGSTGFVPAAVSHIEMDRLTDLWKKYFAWGRGLPELFDTSGEYRALTLEAIRHRIHKGSASSSDYVRSMTLLLLKALPYSAGYVAGRAQQLRERNRRTVAER